MQPQGEQFLGPGGHTLDEAADGQICPRISTYIAGYAVAAAVGPPEVQPGKIVRHTTDVLFQDTLTLAKRQRTHPSGSRGTAGRPRAWGSTTRWPSSRMHQYWGG